MEQGITGQRVIMERFNFSDQVPCGDGTLYLQTHTTESSRAAESLLYEQGRIIAKRTVDLSRVQDVHHLQRAAETFHMENYSELERACTLFSASKPSDADVPALQAVRTLLQWNLCTRALQFLTAAESALGNTIDYWLLKAESLFAQKQYAPALEALKKASMLDRNNGTVLLLLAAGLLDAAAGQTTRLSPDAHARVIEQAETCLSRLVALDNEHTTAARRAAGLMRQGDYQAALAALRS